MINYQNIISVVACLAVIAPISSISSAENCGSTLVREIPVNEAPEKPTVKIPENWVRQAEIEIEYEIPNENTMLMLMQIAKDNVVGDSVDQTKLAVDLLFQFAQFDKYALRGLKGLARVSPDEQLRGYIQSLFLKKNGRRSN